MSANTVAIPHFNIPYSPHRGLPRGVYRVSNHVYRARVKYGGKLYSLGQYKSVRDAENAIRAWYIETYGTSAADAVRHRLATPWSVVWRDDLKTYQLCVWVAGRKTYIAPPKRDGWDKKEEAKEYYPIWARKRFGDKAALSVWRSG